MERQFRPSQDEAHLWAVSMRHHHIPTGFDHVGDIVRGNRRFLTLVGYGLMLFVSNQRVSPTATTASLLAALIGNILTFTDCRARRLPARTPPA